MHHVSRKNRDDRVMDTEELPAEKSISVKLSSLGAFIFLAVGSEVVGESRGLVGEEAAFMPRLRSACSCFLFLEGRVMTEGVITDAVCALPSRWQPEIECWSRKLSIRAFKEG